MKKTLSVLILLTGCITAFAQSVPALLIPTDTRSLSMGGVSSIVEAEHLDVRATYSSWAPSTASNTIAGLDAYIPLAEKFSLFVGGNIFMDKPYSEYDDQGIIKGEFTPKDLIVSLGGEYRVNAALSFGLKGRFVSSSLAKEAKGSAFCADLFATYSTEAFDATLSLSNLGTKIDYGKGSYSLPALVKAFGGYRIVKGLTAALELDYLFNGAFMAGVGAEYWIADIVALRGGYHYGDQTKALPSFASLGIGAKFAGVSISATYLTASPTLGNTLMVGLGYNF